MFWDKNMIYSETGILASLARANGRNWNCSSTEEKYEKQWEAGLATCELFNIKHKEGKEFPAGLPRTSVKIKCNIENGQLKKNYEKSF